MKKTSARRVAALRLSTLLLSSLLLSSLLLTSGLVTTGPRAAAQPATPAQPPATAQAQTQAQTQAQNATAPNFDDPTSTVTIPEVPGVEFLIDNVVTEPGAHQFTVPQGGKTIVVTARGIDGTPNPNPARWAHRFPQVVTPNAPTFDDAALQARTPSHWGVTYRLDGAALKSNSNVDLSAYAGQTATITATPNNPNQVLLLGSTEWSHTFPASSVAPTFDDPTSTVTIPEVAGAEYLIDDQVAPSGPHKLTVPFRGQNVVVTVRGTGGAPDPSPNKWTHRFPEVVEMTPPTFDDRKLMVLTPGRPGVKFRFGEQDMTPASWNDFSAYAGKTVTIRAVANAPTLTLLVGQTEWTHTFVNRPDYSLATGDEFNGNGLAAGWTPAHSNEPGNFKSVSRFENLSVNIGVLDIRTSRHCLADGAEEVSDANKSVAPCRAGTITRYSAGSIRSDFIYGAPKSMEVRAKLDADHHGITSTGWMHNDEPFCNKGVTDTDLAEFDVMEVWATESSQSFSHITCNGGKYHTNGVRVDQHIPGDWHTWRVEWDGYALRYFFDGRPQLGPTGPEVTAATLGLTQEKFLSAINDHMWQTAIGVKLPVNGSWAPWVDDTKDFPDKHDQYDYIRYEPLDLNACQPGGEIGKLWRAHPELGKPSNCEADANTPGARVQSFQSGRVYWSPTTGAQIVRGPILDRFLAAGGDQGLGLPLAAELDGLRDGGSSQVFGKATIFSSPATGAHFVRGEMLKRYAAMGYENSAFGYPTTDEVCGIRDGGCYQRFQHESGHIYWSWPTGAHSIQGAILARYGAMGYESSPIGYPTSDEICGLVSGGCHQRFERESGHIYWSPVSGGWGVQGAIYAHYANNGWEWGRLGYPTGAEQCRNLPGALECTQTFQRGKVIWNSRTGVRG